MSHIISEQDFIQKYPNYDILQASSFIDYCKIHNNTIPESSIILASRIFFNRELPTRHVPVITLRMGLGKTTIVNLYNMFMRTQDREYGSIISVERIQTIKETIEKYPEYYGLYGFQKSDCIKNMEYYNPNMCRVCDETTCRVSLNEIYVPVSPILMITHSRLNLIMQDKRALADLMYFYNQERNHQFRRIDMFVDECPGFFTIDHLSEQNFLTFQNALHSVYRRDCKQRRELIDYFKPMIQDIRLQLQSDYTGFYRINTITQTKDMFAHFLFCKRKFMLNYYGAYYQLCLNVLNAIQQGGYIKNHMFTAPREHELEVGDYRTFILDGTAHINASYPQKCLIIDFQDKREFNNVTWNIDSSHNLSKEYYHSHPDFIPKIKDVIIKQLEKHHKILLITFKELEESYISYFTKEQLERIYINHFNNLKGKNHYRDATCMFYLGTIYKGDIYYRYYYRYCKNLEGEIVDIEKIDFMNRDSQRVPIHLGTKELHKELQQLIGYDQADMIVQDGFRCEPRENELSISDYFIFCTNDELPEKIQSFYPGATINNTILIKNESAELSNFKQTLIQINNESNQLTIINKRDIIDRCNISRQAFTKFMKNKEIISYLTENKIIVKRYGLSFKSMPTPSL